jgi:hypothetical protein
MELTKEQKEQIQELIRSTGAQSVIATSDGNVFTEQNRNAAQLHAAEKSLSTTTIVHKDLKVKKAPKSADSKKKASS